MVVAKVWRKRGEEYSQRQRHLRESRVGRTRLSWAMCVGGRGKDGERRTRGNSQEAKGTEGLVTKNWIV